jgi:6-phosphofructokinase 1
LEDVEALRREVKGIVICVSEGLVDRDGNPVADAGFTDGFGHKVPGGVAQALANMLITGLGMKARAEKPGLLGRASAMLQSPVDREEAIGVGAHAVRAAVSGVTGVMVTLIRDSNDPYHCSFGYAPLEKVANAERKFPAEWINTRGNGIEKAFADYCLPLLGAPLPQYARLRNAAAHK